MCTGEGVHLEVRGQPSGVNSLLPPCGSKDQTQITRPGSKSLYLLSHLTNHKTCVPIQINNSNNSSSWLFYSFVLFDGIANQTLGPTRW